MDKGVVNSRFICARPSEIGDVSKDVSGGVSISCNPSLLHGIDLDTEDMVVLKSTRVPIASGRFGQFAQSQDWTVCARAHRCNPERDATLLDNLCKPKVACVVIDNREGIPRLVNSSLIQDSTLAAVCMETKLWRH